MTQGRGGYPWTMMETTKCPHRCWWRTTTQLRLRAPILEGRALNHPGMPLPLVPLAAGLRRSGKLLRFNSHYIRTTTMAIHHAACSPTASPPDEVG